MMLFYKVSAILTDEKWCESNNDRRMRTEHVRAIAAKSESFHQEHGKERYCFVSHIGDNDIICGILSTDYCEISGTAREFLQALKLPVKDLRIDEITFSSIKSLLARACRNDYIEDDDEILDEFELDKLSGYRGEINYDESLLEIKKSKKSLYETAVGLLAEETLCAELDRIYSGKAQERVFGHPVHYFLEADNPGTRKAMSCTLLQALYENGRLKSRRYCYIDFRPGEVFSQVCLESLYKSCMGGAMIIRYHANENSDHNEYTGGEYATILMICEMITKYRNRVLTVVCLPRACRKEKKSFLENLGDIGMIEIFEDLADTERSKAYLKMLCREEQIRPDRDLYGRLEEEKRYLPDELHDLFSEWYNLKMKTVIFPQYREIASCRKEAVKETVRGTSFDELQEMIGLIDAKEVIGKALNYYKLLKIYKDRGVKQDHPAMHMIFSGNPGTAKTTVARLFARIMKENGLLSKGHLVEVGRSDLVGKFVGWTAPTVKEKFESALGGVLFIDEAYSLVDDREGLYGDEAINTIVQEMENRREDLVVIFAGYPQKMEHFLEQNPGLRSRIAFHVPFADYSAPELCEIARLIGRSKGVALSDAALSKLETIFETARQQPDFGNGRYVRNLIELSKMNLASRILKSDPEQVSDEMLTLIEESDILIPTIKTAPPRNGIGFIA